MAENIANGEIMKELVLVVSKDDIKCLGTIRNLSYLKCSLYQEQVWIRATLPNDHSHQTLKKLPVLKTYWMDDKANLFVNGSLTPIDTLPTLEWKTICDFIPVEPPASALPGKVSDVYHVKLIRSEYAKEGTALLTNLKLWKQFGETTSDIRLQQLQFAVSKNGEVLILGDPLPSIPGKEIWTRGTILLPAGYDLEIPILAQIIEEKLNPCKDSFLLFDENGQWEIIVKSNVIQATRSGIRLTEVF